ncbi:hypothetical protein, partial [Bacteroides thetaiotaomicron]|uniref:hypothetical protein n=1 Tax=Bacteroides thetaiotaomicron TaxID=818 RepID=UPI0022E8CE70
GRQKTRKRAVRKVKQTIRFCLQNRIPISLPQVTGGERVSNGLPGQTVKGIFSGLPIISRIADDYGQTGNENSHSDEGEGGEEYCVNAKTLSDM